MIGYQSRQPAFGARDRRYGYGARRPSGIWTLRELVPSNIVRAMRATVNTVTGYPGTLAGIGYGMTGHPLGGADSFKTINLESSSTGLIPGQDGTFLWYGIPKNLVSDYGNLMCRGDDSSGNGSNLRLRIKTDGNAEWSYVDTSPAGFTATTSGASLSVDTPCLLIAVKRGTTVKVWAKNSSGTITTASASGGNGNLRTSGVGVGLNWTGNSTLTAGGASSAGHNVHVFCAVWPLGLYDSECWSLINNPWQLVAPEIAEELRRFGVAAAAGYTLTADAGSFTYTGQTATLRVARKLVAGAGAFSFTGQTATLRVARKIGAAAGAYTMSGADAGLIYSGSGARLTAEAGSYGLTGAAATLRVARRLAADSGSYVFSGGAATLTYSGEAVSVTVGDVLTVPAQDRVWYLGRQSRDVTVH